MCLHDDTPTHDADVEPAFVQYTTAAVMPDGKTEHIEITLTPRWGGWRVRFDNQSYPGRAKVYEVGRQDVGEAREFADAFVAGYADPPRDLAELLMVLGYGSPFVNELCERYSATEVAG